VPKKRTFSPWLTFSRLACGSLIDRDAIEFCLAILSLKLSDGNTMIEEVSGDILLSSAQAIAHGIAPNEHFDSGLALALREQWPAMAKDFRHYAHQSHPKPGELWMWGGVGGVTILNLLTLEGEHTHGSRPGKATLANVNHCLRSTARITLGNRYWKLLVNSFDRF
jgi:hypothetical protein